MKKQITGDMPHSLEAEQALLGCLLLDGKIQVEVVAFLSEEDFFAESHKYIFNAMNGIVKSNQTVDLVTLVDALEKSGTLEQAGGISYITELTNVMPSSANYHHYLDIVTRDGMLRKLIKGAKESIIEYFESHSEEILGRIDSYMKAKDYKSAAYEAYAIPMVCRDLYNQASERIAYIPAEVLSGINPNAENIAKHFYSEPRGERICNVINK